MMRKKIAFVLLFASLLLVTPALATDLDVSGSADSSVNEVYFYPTQIDENTYVYYGEDGQIVARWEAGSTANTTTRAANFTYRMTLTPGNYQKVSNSLDTTQSTRTVYISVNMSPSGKTFIGHYLQPAGYSWYETPRETSGVLSVMIGSNYPIYMAIKNASNRTITYSGEYGFNPI